jgi:putative two-component system response regulator
METRKPTILIIEDDDMQYEIYEDSLSSSYRILRAKKGTEAIEIVKKEIPDLIILDHILEGVVWT